jgi:hypothetical protein
VRHGLPAECRSGRRNRFHFRECKLITRTNTSSGVRVTVGSSRAARAPQISYAPVGKLMPQNCLEFSSLSTNSTPYVDNPCTDAITETMRAVTCVPR